MQQSAYMNPAAGAEFVGAARGHRRLIFKVANTYGRGRADVEDLAQEIAAQSWRAFPAYDPQRSFSTWLYRIALNVAISWLRVEAPRRRRSVAYDAELHDAAVSEAGRRGRRQPHPARLHRLAGAARSRRAAAVPRRAPVRRDRPRSSASPPPTSLPRSIASRSGCAPTRRNNMELDELKAPGRRLDRRVQRTHRDQSHAGDRDDHRARRAGGSRR